MQTNTEYMDRFSMMADTNVNACGIKMINVEGAEVLILMVCLSLPPVVLRPPTSLRDGATASPTGSRASLTLVSP